MKCRSFHRSSARRARGGRNKGGAAFAPSPAKACIQPCVWPVVRSLASRRRARLADPLAALLAVLIAVLIGSGLALADQGTLHQSVGPQGTPHESTGSETGPTSADTVLESVFPQPQAWLPEPPRQVTLRFRESLQPAGSAITVFTSQGKVAGSIAFPDSRTMTFQFQDPLGEGTYFVEWQASLSGGHTAEGRFHFTYLTPAVMEEPLDRREVNRLLGNLLPPWLLWLPAALGVGALIWGLWSMWRNE